nr:lamin tail domain-containing protein [Hyalangium gracile]
MSSPNGGESWIGASSHPITWTSSGVTNVKLEYTLDGSTWTTITSSTAASTGSYTWTLPNAGSTTARVRASDASNSAITDTSDGTFTITGASVTVLSPNGGESWQGGSSQSITWTSSGVTNVKLEYTLNGSTWTTIAASTAASAGSYPWTVPNIASTAAQVRVSDASSSVVRDISDAAFTILSSGGGDPTGVFINETLVNEVGGNENTSTEFVELVNSSTGPVDISGWTISDAAALRHTFASGTVLEAGKAIVVFGGEAGIPPGLTNAVAASTGKLELSNSSDTVTVRTSAGTTVDVATFSGTLVQEGISANRNPDGALGGPFVPHNTLSTLKTSPGTRADATPF